VVIMFRYVNSPYRDTTLSGLCVDNYVHDCISNCLVAGRVFKHTRKSISTALPQFFLEWSSDTLNQSVIQKMPFLLSIHIFALSSSVTFSVCFLVQWARLNWLSSALSYKLLQAVETQLTQSRPSRLSYVQCGIFIALERQFSLRLVINY